MRYLHTMVRISNIEESLKFYCELLGLIESRRIDSEAGRYTNIFLCAPLDKENYELIALPRWSLPIIGTQKNMMAVVILVI